MTKRVLIAAAHGSEDIELITLRDILDRAGFAVTTASVTGAHEITLSHGTRVICDSLIADVHAENFDAVLLPGGMPGATHLAESAALKHIMVSMKSQNKLFGAICASPVVVLLSMGLLENVKSITCYPAFGKQLPPQIKFESAQVVYDSNCLTSQGPGTSIAFALAAVMILSSRSTAQSLANDLLVGDDKNISTMLETLMAQ